MAELKMAIKMTHDEVVLMVSAKEYHCFCLF